MVSVSHIFEHTSNTLPVVMAHIVIIDDDTPAAPLRTVPSDPEVASPNVSLGAY
jgi:hypothetical protein